MVVRVMNRFRVTPGELSAGEVQYLLTPEYNRVLFVSALVNTINTSSVPEVLTNLRRFGPLKRQLGTRLLDADRRELQTLLSNQEAPYSSVKAASGSAGGSPLPAGGAFLLTLAIITPIASRPAPPDSQASGFRPSLVDAW
jgi:hypothetical protein